MTQPNIALDFEATDLAALLRTSLEPLVLQASASGIELRVVTIGDVPQVSIDREKIAWCVATLVGNALRYVSKADDDDGSGGSVLVHLDHEPELVSIAIQDDGPGI